MRMQTRISELANFLLVLWGDMNELMDKFDSDLETIQQSYSRQFAATLAGAGFTVESFCSEWNGLCSRKWLEKSELYLILELADPRSPFSPIHEHNKLCGCGATVRPFDPDDPWGELERIELRAEM